MNKPTKLHLINQNNKKNSTLLNQYDLLDEMTQGKTGTVSLIKKIGTNNLFVLKKQNFDITKITKEEKSRFTNEEKLLKTLHRLEAVEWVTPSERLLIQPYYPTMSLFELSLTKIIVAQEIRVKIVEQCFNKLFELHQKGWIHADLQPSNIIIDFAEKNGTMTELKNMYIIDFGQALKLAKNKEICTIPMNSKINPTYYGYYFYNLLQ